MGHSLDLPEARNGDSFPRAGQGRAIPVTTKGHLFQLVNDVQVQWSDWVQSAGVQWCREQSAVVQSAVVQYTGVG